MPIQPRPARSSRHDGRGGRAWLVLLATLALAACTAGPAATRAPGTGAPEASQGAAAAAPDASADPAAGNPGSAPAELPAPEQGEVPAPETTPVLTGSLTVGQPTAPVSGTLAAGGGTFEADGLTLVAPAGAFAVDTSVAVTSAPAALADPAAYGGAVVAATPLYTIETGSAEPGLPVTVTLALTGGSPSRRARWRWPSTTTMPRGSCRRSPRYAPTGRRSRRWPRTSRRSSERSST